MKLQSINLEEKFSLIREHWSPRVIGELNDYQVKLAKFLGDFVWHRHEDTDELFLCLSGRLTIELRDRTIEVNAGEIYIVPKGVEHRPRAEEECHVLLIEPKGVINTGNAEGELTAPNDRWI